MGGWTARVYTAEQQARLGVDEEGQKRSAEKPAQVQAIGPAWTRGGVEAPASTKDMGGWTARVYTAEQQARLGVDEIGDPASSSARPFEYSREFLLSLLRTKVSRKYSSAQAAFRAFDQDCNNYISIYDWQRTFRRFNVDASQEELQRLVQFHADYLGRVSFAEFCSMVSGTQARPLHLSPAITSAVRPPLLQTHIICDQLREHVNMKWASLRTAFMKLDTDNSGFINHEEFSAALQDFNLRLDLSTLE